ncbi:MAG: glycosyltransferase [Rhizobacter sp.]|nr:glycosyltransferase [Bacteriovorax sp.]
MKKILIIKSSKQSTWGSCKVISPNLVLAYEQNKDFFDIQYFELPESFIREEINEGASHIISLANKIKDFEPDSLVFIDHLPHPVRILNTLAYFIVVRSMPPLVFHMYGDFTYFAKDWANLNTRFKNHPIKFIAASEAQKNLMNFFLNDNKCTEQYLFPVNENEYFFNPVERALFRNQMNVRPMEPVILYSGRISLQKNVDVLVREFTHIVKATKHDVHLWIVGTFDDIGATFMGVKNHDGFMYSKMQKVLSGLDPEVARLVKFLGLQKKGELRKIKAAADMFMSFSLYHDEDYGMSPAEALASGLPTLLTNWGGYYSFASGNKWNCKLVPVEITKYGHKIHTKKIHEFYTDFTQSYINENDRKRWSNEFLSEFGVVGSAHKLRTILDKDFENFTGFHWNLEHFSNLYWAVDIGKEINIHLNPSVDTFYHQVYKNYIKNLNIENEL